MFEKTSDHDQHPESDARPEITLGALAFARTVAAEFVKLETGYRNGLYNCIGNALTSYRKFLKEPADYEELLGEPNIKGLPEKPEVQVTSRLVLYFHTGAKTDGQRNTAGKYARIVDHLHKERVENAAAAAERIRKAGGIAEILKEARREAPKRTTGEVDATVQQDERESDQEEGSDETDTGTDASGQRPDEIFDPDYDLSIWVKDEVRAKVLGPEIAMGEEFHLKCKKMDSAGRDWIQIVGILVDPPSE